MIYLNHLFYDNDYSLGQFSRNKVSDLFGILSKYSRNPNTAPINFPCGRSTEVALKDSTMDSYISK